MKDVDSLNELLKIAVEIDGLEICICKVKDLAKQDEFRLV